MQTRKVRSCKGKTGARWRKDGLGSELTGLLRMERLRDPGPGREKGGTVPGRSGASWASEKGKGRREAGARGAGEPSRGLGTFPSSQCPAPGASPPHGVPPGPQLTFAPPLQPVLPGKRAERGSGEWAPRRSQPRYLMPPCLPRRRRRSRYARRSPAAPAARPRRPPPACPLRGALRPRRPPA